MDELVVGDTWRIESDVGPVIDDAARKDIAWYIDAARARGKVLKECARPARGSFVGPTVTVVDGIADLEWRGVRPRAACRHVPAERTREGHRRRQRRRLWVDLWRAHAHRWPRRADHHRVVWRNVLQALPLARPTVRKEEVKPRSAALALGPPARWGQKKARRINL